MRLVVLLFGYLAFHSQAFAGMSEWISGGGARSIDGGNPWFINNTGRVRYCIKHDEVNFGAPLDQVRDLTNQAFAYWADDFASVQNPISGRDPDIQFKVATQEFVEVSCANTHDIAFQFGILEGEQFQYIGNPQDYVGLAVRTNYDRVNLRGRGFIYIGPARGPMSWDDSRYVEDPWRRVMADCCTKFSCTNSVTFLASIICRAMKAM